MNPEIIKAILQDGANVNTFLKKNKKKFFRKKG